MTTKSSGFSLVELLVVVAILGIIATIGIVSYSGYVSGAKRKSAENVMQQIALGQSEYYSEQGDYYYNSASSCTPSSTTSTNIETNLLGGSDNINDEVGYEICVHKDSDAKFLIIAKEKPINDTSSCELKMNGLNQWCPTKTPKKCSC